MNFKCDDCGSENVVKKNAKGRKFGFQKWDEIELLVDLELHTCEECGNIMVVGNDYEKLQKALEKSIRVFKSQNKSALRYQIVKIGAYFQVRYKKSFLRWEWSTEIGRKGDQVISRFLDFDTAKKSAERFVEHKKKLHSKVPGMTIVYDSEKC